ncbi:MAG: hypothetical protein HC907_14970 [Richelia sp. SM1_7_0]|nr:hypothetical protein [Richelia sp. SM1_7_0]
MPLIDFSTVLGVSPDRALKAFQDIEYFFAKEFGTIPETLHINSRLTDGQMELIKVGVDNQSRLELLLSQI